MQEVGTHGETNHCSLMQRMFRYTFFRIVFKNARKSYVEVSL